MNAATGASDITAAVHADLLALVAYGPRFHGTSGIAGAADWLEERLHDAGLITIRQQVASPGWRPGSVCRVIVKTPTSRELPAWPMLWSGSSGGIRSGTVEPVGPQGLWGDSMTWRKFGIASDDEEPVGYLHARDDGPAAPQPLPSGSDFSVAHMAIGRLDGLQLSEWHADGKSIAVEIQLDSGPTDAAISDNLIVDIPGAGPRMVMICAHYDTFFNTVGAYDNGSGTIALLHLARLWAASPPAQSVRLVFFTAEEWHLRGSRHYVDTATSEELEAIDYVINLDGLGRGSFLEAFIAPETFSASVRTAILQYRAGNRPDLELACRFPPTSGTDDASFYRAGVPSAFLTFNDLHRLHQPNDEPNMEIAGNVTWTVSLVERLVSTLEAPRRAAPPGIL